MISPAVEYTVMRGKQDSTGAELKDMVTVGEIHPWQRGNLT